MKIVEFENSVDPKEVVHIEPPHLYLHCLPSRYDLIYGQNAKKLKAIFCWSICWRLLWHDYRNN